MKRLLSRFNSLGTRERLGIIAALVVATYFIMDASLIGPEQRRQKALKAEITKIDAELAAVRADMVVVKAHLEKDPFAKDREQLDAFKKVIDEANAFIAKVDTNPKQVGALLRQMIAATPGLTLLSLKTIPPTALIDAKGAGVAKQAATRSIYRHGVEVTIKGNYLTLLPYVEKLENLPTRVLWVEANLSVGTYPEATLKLMIYTLSGQREGSLG